MSARDVLYKAILCDQQGRVLEAQHLYQQGIQMLMELLEDADEERKRGFYDRIKEYLERAEQIKQRVNKQMETGELEKHISIEDDSTGNGYSTLFSNYLNKQVKEVLIEEPYLGEKYQQQNLVQFLELLVKKCSDLKYVRVITKKSQKVPDTQQSSLDQISGDLKKRSITFHVIHEDTLHDRKIILSNGYIIKVGRGLHFFKALNPLFSLGMFDYDFRRCLQTDVDVWRTKQ